MELTPKQLTEAIQDATKNLATKDDLKAFATKTDLEKVEERLATTVASSFQQVYDRLDRMENIIDKWPPPSYVTDLLERVSQIEKLLKLRPHTH